VESLVEENSKSGKVRGNVPDPEKKPPTMPTTSKKNLMMRLALPLAPQKRTGTPLAREILKRNLAKRVEENNTESMNTDQSNVKPG
jgi:hypothetical protein